MHSIWAVATNTIRQALRMKVAVVFTVLLLILLPVMGLRMTGDGTLKGQLQTFVSYGLSLTSLLLCLLTIIISVYAVTSDLKQKQLYTVLTKPIRRFQLLLGKLLGVILVDVGLLAFFATMIYTITISIPLLGKAFHTSTILLAEFLLITVWQMIHTLTRRISIWAKVMRLIAFSAVLIILSVRLLLTISFYPPLEFSQAELVRAKNEFFTARAGLQPPEVDVQREVTETYNKLRKSGQLEQVFRELSHKKIIAELTKQKQLQKRAAGVGRSLLWEFNNVKIVDPNLFIRYKYDVSVTPADLHVYGRWVVGDLRQIRFATKKQTDIYTFTPRNPIRTFCEVEVPADAVAADGYLGVQFINLPINNTPVIFPPDGLEILYKADTFGANFLRAAVLILLRLIFLACLGILASSFLSFPVAILLCLVIFFTATVSTFVIDSFNYITAELSGVYSYAVKPIVQLLPQFDKFNPAKSLVSGRLLSWQLLATAAGLMVCIKALLLLLLAVLIFRYREIAKIVI